MRKISILFLFLIGCSSPDATEKTLLDAGYEDIEILGWAPFHCGEDDSWSTKTKHTHHPVDDAKGNAEALLELKKMGLEISL